MPLYRKHIPKFFISWCYSYEAVASNIVSFALEWKSFVTLCLQHQSVVFFCVEMAEDNNSVESVSSQDEANSSQASFSSLSPSYFRQIDYEFIVGARANSKLLYSNTENQIYSFNTNSRLGKSYMCTYSIGKKRVCSARVYLVDNNRCIQLHSSPSHNHTDNRQSLKRELFCLNEIKQRCGALESFLTTTKLTVRDIFNQVLLE